MQKKIFIVFSILIIIMLWSGCKKSVVEIMYPDIAGDWDWIIKFSKDECLDRVSEEGYATITQEYVDSDTSEGQVMIYNKDDLSCVVWYFDYTMDSNGNAVIAQTNVPYDPDKCANSASPDAKGDVVFNLNATASQITGDLTHRLFSLDEGWSCDQNGTITLNKQ